MIEIIKIVMIMVTITKTMNLITKTLAIKYDRMAEHQKPQLRKR